MAATEEKREILSVLLLLRRSEEHWGNLECPVATIAAVNVATGGFTAVTEAELENHFLHTGASGIFHFHVVICVKPPAKETSAVSGLWCRCNFSAASAKCGFYLGTWWKTQTAPLDAADCRRNVVFLGFRYDTPEVGDNQNYCHAQPCRSMRE